ncbi:hypothetical protein GCM10009603_34830 [Nocardiopsis exhalans]
MTTTVLAPELLHHDGQAGILAQEADHPTWQYMPHGLPGFLQTPDHAHALAELLPHVEYAHTEQVRLRLQRGEQMRTRTHLRHRFILGPEILNTTTPLMADQYAHLVELDQLDHIQIRIRPAGPVVTDPTGFTLRAGRAWIEAADLYFAAPGNIATWHKEWERLWAQTVPLTDHQGPN